MHSASLKTRKILVADDDLAIVDALKMMLELSDYTVETVVDGKIIPKIKVWKPDLLLLDIWMNGVDGREVCRTIKKDKMIQDLPVVLISASNGIVKSTEEACANDFLEKPFDMDVLLAKIEKYI